MTSGDDTDPAPAGKSLSDAHAFVDALERLGRLPSELQEPQPDLPLDLASLDRLDPLEPGNEALALWIIEQLRSGDLIAYGRPIGTGRFRPSPIPTAAWPDLALHWSSGRAEHMVATSRWGGAAWSELRVPAGDLPDLPPSVPQSTTLPIVFGDAIAWAQRWRERRLIPDGYPWPEAEFWKANPAQRPDQCEVAAALESAIRAGELTAVWESENGEWLALPKSAWNASHDRVDILKGRLNIGVTIAEHIAATEMGVASRCEERWRLAFLPWRELLDWCEAKWKQQPATSQSSDLAHDSSAENEIAPATRAEAADQVPKKGRGGAPRRYDWDKLGAAFGAWLHDEPGRDRLTPPSILKPFWNSRSG